MASFAMRFLAVMRILIACPWLGRAAAAFFRQWPSGSECRDAHVGV